MNAQQLKAKLIERAEHVVSHLFPAGVKHGNRVHVGSLNGEKGDSLRIDISGSRAGVWSDFGSGEAGDIIELWLKRTNKTYREAAPEIHAFLGEKMRMDESPKKTYEKPKEVMKLVTEQSKAWEYLTKDRMIAASVIKDLKLGIEGTSIVYPYREEDGALCMAKCIGMEKVEGRKVVRLTSSGCKPILFGMNSKLVKESQGILVICEGEVDALTYQSQGIPAVSVPFGAKKEKDNGTSPNDEWIENCYTWLDRFHTIYVSMDMDTEGRAASDAIIKRLGNDRCYRVNLPLKDANECHMAKMDLNPFIKQAESIDPEGIKMASSLSAKVWNVVRNGRREESGIIPFDWVGEDGKPFQFRLRPREGTVVTGYQAGGKSNFIYQLMAWLATVKDQKVFIGSYEEPADQILAIMTNHVIGRQLSSNEFYLFEQVRDRLLSNVIIHDHEGTVKHKDYFDNARYAVRRHGVKWAVLDGASCLDVNLDENHEVEGFVKESQSFWKGSEAHLMVLAHPRKAQDKSKAPTILDIKGSGYFGDLFFNCISVWRKPHSKTEGKVSISKQKVGGMEPETNTYYERGSMRLLQSEEEVQDMKPYITLT